MLNQLQIYYNFDGENDGVGIHEGGPNKKRRILVFSAIGGSNFGGNLKP
jgi:hypothetical protein